MLSNRVFGLVAVFLLSITIPSNARAQTPMGEVMCACPGLAKPLGKAATCEEACYGKRSSPGGASSDTRAREDARAREEAAARAREEADAAERDRIAEEKRRKDKEESDAKFIRDRDEAASMLKGSTGTTTLKGSIGTSVGDNSGTGLRGSGSDGPGGTELRGSRNDTVTLKGESKREPRDFSGPHAAWKELVCAASILGPAISNLGIDGNGKPDYAGFRSMADEAINALNGEVKGVPCAKAEEPPMFSGKYSDPAKMTEAGIRLVNKAVDLATRLEKAREKKTAAQAELNKPAPTVAPAKSDESVIAQQRRINVIRDAEAKRIAQADRDFKTGVTTENEAKAKLRKIADDVKQAGDDPKNFDFLFAEDVPEASPPKPKPPARRAGRP